MRKVFLAFLLVCAGGLAVLTILAPKISAYSSGAPSGFTGSNVDGRSCATPSCHSGAPKLVSGWVNTDIPIAGFLPGQTYSLTFTATRTGVGRYGFQASVIDTSNNHTGSFATADPGQTQLGTGAHYITHTSAGSYGSGGMKNWTVLWTAPVNYPLWPVTLFAAFVAGDSIGNDSVYLTSIRLIPQSMGLSSNEMPTFFRILHGEQSLKIILLDHSSPVIVKLFDLTGRCLQSHKLGRDATEVDIAYSTNRGVNILVIESRSRHSAIKVFF